MASAAGQGLRPGPVQRWVHPPAGGRATIHGGFDVLAETVFDLAVFPDLAHDPTSDDGPPPNFGGCHLRLEFVTTEFDTTGRVVTLRDQHEHPVDGTRSCLVAENWNLLRLDLSPLVGQHVQRVDLVAVPAIGGGGWLQVLGTAPTPNEPADVVQRVRTTRGTHSGYLYSRGNTLPTTCLPQGFNFLSPLTNARDNHWRYGYHRDGGARPHLQALAFVHQPSPWIGDRAAFQLMPWQATRPPARIEDRTRRFDHEREVDHPHHYRVELDGGITAEMVPTARAGVFRFTWADPEQRHGLMLDQSGRASSDAWSLPDGRVAFRAAIIPAMPPSGDYQFIDPAAYVYGETTGPARIGRIRERRSLHNSWLGRLFSLPRRRRQALVLETGAGVLEVRAAMSFLGVEQARRNLALEVGADDLVTVARRARAEWADLLERLDVVGGTRDQRTTAWSNLCRLYSWPNEHHENVGSNEEPRWAYASPFHEPRPPGREVTSCRVVAGRLLVNNGYWDTARTCWPLYSLLTPRRAAGMLDASLQQYRDGGWMARWSAPGYVDIMPGTSSDAVFADASAQRTLDDEVLAYDSALRNATTTSQRPAVGRKGLGRARFLGWVDTDTVQGLPWTLENATCDAAIALWSERLHRRALQGASELVDRAEEFAANHRWFSNRALAHELVFDAAIGFYQGRHRNGEWRRNPEQFNPTVWGEDYCETNAWGQAFHAQHDGAGLARLLGGEDALAAKLDQMLATPAVTQPSLWGSHDYNTQEMNEAQNIGLGQLAISNQPAHHIPFMYLFAGQPWKTQWLTRELLDTQFVGSEIGQGYPGDEDNGEMSGWWLCASLGLYPLFPGSGEWVITAPLFGHMSFRRDDGSVLEVRADHPEHRYIQSLTVNGKIWNRVAIPVELLQGDCVLHFSLGPEPSSWGSHSRPFSSSVDHTGTPIARMADRSLQADLEGPHLLVDDEGTRSHALRCGEQVVLRWPESFVPSFLTLTALGCVPLALRVETCAPDGAWSDADIEPRRPRWSDQTQAYLLDPTPIIGLRLVATATLTLSQVEVY